MRIIYGSLIAFLLYCCSCTGSREAAIRKQAQKDIDQLTTLIDLRADQTHKALAIQTDYLSQAKKLKDTATDAPALKKIRELRADQFRELLSHQQYLQWKIWEQGGPNPNVPIRSN
ncbi:hypothetical protein GCM10027051_34550 [Niabella terrae]